MYRIVFIYTSYLEDCHDLIQIPFEVITTPDFMLAKEGWRNAKRMYHEWPLRFIGASGAIIDSYEPEFTTVEVVQQNNLSELITV